MDIRKQWRQWKTKDMIKGVVIVLMCTGVLCLSVFAEEESDPASNVWLEAIQVPTQAQISVTVPLSYGFAVIGSVESGDTVPVSTERGNLLLPNVRVKVTTPSGSLPGVPGGAEYAIQTVSQQSLPIRNYSTDVRDENAEEEIPLREGLPVEVKPYLIALPVDDNLASIGIHHWQPSSTDPTWDGDAATVDAAKLDFKKYQIILDDLAFSEPGEKNINTELSNGNKENKRWPVFWLENEETIALDAPPDVAGYGYTSAGTAQIPSEKYISVQVKIGGMQNQYKQVEESLKVGAIYWDIIPGDLPVVTVP